MKEYRDRPKPTMSEEEMVKDYPRLAREYTLLHQDYREAIRKPLNITDVSQQRELLIAELKEWDLGYTSFNNLEEKLAEKLLKAINCG